MVLLEVAHELILGIPYEKAILIPVRDSVTEFFLPEERIPIFPESGKAIIPTPRDIKVFGVKDNEQREPLEVESILFKNINGFEVAAGVKLRTTPTKKYIHFEADGIVECTPIAAQKREVISKSPPKKIFVMERDEPFLNHRSASVEIKYKITDEDVSKIFGRRDQEYLQKQIYVRIPLFSDEHNELVQMYYLENITIKPYTTIDYTEIVLRIDNNILHHYLEKKN